MNKALSILAVVLSLIGVGISVFCLIKTSETAYIRTEEVYNNFKLKKELEQKLNATTEKRSRILDSLAQELGLLSEEINAEKLKEGDKINRFNFLRKQYASKKEEFDQMNGQLTQQYTEQIWKQLNQYIREYGGLHGYQYIYGSHGEGNLMYAAENKDITAEVKEYVNKKYEGDIP